MTIVALRPWARRLAVGMAGLSAAVVLVAGGIYGAVQYDGNFHAVEPGVVYRSAQLSGRKLDEVVRGYQIRTVLNLRGDNTGKPWYDEELRTARADGIVHLDYALSAQRELTQAQMQAVLKLIADAPKPVLIHCNAGSDRTGLASALYELSRGVPPAEAGAQLSLRYGHFPWFGSRSVAMDRSLAAWVASAPSAPAR